jgi:CRP-like cAMP-binding protein
MWDRVLQLASMANFPVLNTPGPGVSVNFRNTILATLNGDSLAALKPYLREVDLLREEVLIEAGDPPGRVWFPETAVLSSVRPLGDGRIAEGAEGLLDCLSGEPSGGRVAVQVEGAAVVVPAAAISALAAADPALRRVLLRAVRDAVDQAEQRVACNVFHEAASRLSRWLLEIGDKAGTDAFPLTQEHMAVLLGVQRTTANAAAQRLKIAGAISYRRGLVRIVSRGRLEAMTCECHRPPAMLPELPAALDRRRVA